MWIEHGLTNTICKKNSSTSNLQEFTTQNDLLYRWFNVQQTEINDNGKLVHMFFQANSGEHIKHEEATGNLLNSKGTQNTNQAEHPHWFSPRHF